MAVMRSLVANDFGYSLANIRTLSETSPDGQKLKFVPLAGSIRPLRLGPAFSSSIHMSRTIRAFLDHCDEMISSGDVPGLSLPQRP